MLGNLLFLVNKLSEMSRLFLGRPMPDVISGQNPLLILVGQAALVVGYIAFYRQYAPQGIRSRKIALGLFSGGGIVLAVGHVGFVSALGDLFPPSGQAQAENLFILVLLGGALMIPGLIWFGILNLRQPALDRWRWLPLLTGLVGFIGFFLFSGEVITAIFLTLRTLFALGLMGLGLALWLGKPVQAEAAG